LLDEPSVVNAVCLLTFWMTAVAVGERVLVLGKDGEDDEAATVAYVGAVAGTSGSWVGVCFDSPGRGKHDGEHCGVRYFACDATAGPRCASLVRSSRVAGGVTLLQALQAKYEEARPVVHPHHCCG